MLQVGARNMQNFALLRRLATIKKPILLKRGPSATVKEWLLAAEYLLSGGNDQVAWWERGIKTFETATRQYVRPLCRRAGGGTLAPAGGSRSFA
jgi:3-deoxy-7-phosphoheptulonate synthase